MITYEDMRLKQRNIIFTLTGLVLIFLCVLFFIISNANAVTIDEIKNQPIIYSPIQNLINNTYYNSTINESYIVANGRAGGQVLTGGINANDDIVITGTSSSTKTTSYVLIQPNLGNVGIGILAPLAPLHVKGTQGGTSNTFAYVESTSPTGQAGIQFLLNTANIGRVEVSDKAMNFYVFKPTTQIAMVINLSQAYVGLGTLTPTGQLDMTGQFRDRSCSGTPTFSADGNMTCSSDEKLKDKIVPFTSSTSIIKNIVPITWDWQPSSGYIGKSTGFSAQNIQSAGLPSAVIARTDYKYVQEVAKSKDGTDETEIKAIDLGSKTLSIDQTVILAASINSIKEQQTLIEVQQKEIDSLKLRLDKAGIK